MNENINPDGSMKGATFSGNNFNGDYPSPHRGKETFAQYHARVSRLRQSGFHLGDLGFGDYKTYCMGSGNYDDFDADDIII